MTTEDRIILDLILRSAEEEIERDLRIVQFFDVLQFLEEAMSRAAFRRLSRTAQCSEHVAAHSNIGKFPSQSGDSLHEEWTRDDLSSRKPGQVIVKPQGHARTIESLEEGEIREDPDSPETSQWEQFTEFKKQMSSIANGASREEQLRQFCNFEHQIAQAMWSLKVEEWIENQIDTSLRGVRREADRILVEVEGSLLRCKAEVYTKVWKDLNDVLTQCQHITSLWGT